MEEENDIDKRFNKYINIVKKIEDVSDDDKLYLYAYYKQANFGDNKTPRPFILNRVDMAKWKAWNDVKGISKEEAVESYVKKVKELYKNYMFIKKL